MVGFFVYVVDLKRPEINRDTLSGNTAVLFMPHSEDNSISSCDLQLNFPPYARLPVTYGTKLPD